MTNYVKSLMTQIEAHMDRVKKTMETLRARHRANMLSPDAPSRQLLQAWIWTSTELFHDQVTSYWSHEYSRACRAVVGSLQDLLNDLSDQISRHS
ncbi:hypothetical protein DPV78_003880 [Talaromyces pinophilus]|nr:hypothetical protein DPV78_003880 [Talaromyces pinophilus]